MRWLAVLTPGRSWSHVRAAGGPAALGSPLLLPRLAPRAAGIPSISASARTKQGSSTTIRAARCRREIFRDPQAALPFCVVFESSCGCPKSCLGARYTTDLQFGWHSLPPVGLMSFLGSLQGRMEEPAELGRRLEPPPGGKSANRLQGGEVGSWYRHHGEVPAR